MQLKVETKTGNRREMLRTSEEEGGDVEHILQDMEEIVDGADEKLVELKREWGEEVYRAVSVACVEAIEYTSSGRYTVPEFWNFKEGRKACVEAIEVS
ncbi:hypothetical protein GIB67_029904 [Kingdonia uniflora]|uniref:Factor of DNA methylation 1-5/IDN2 domain-containing protein n=1 Tax=Kingdonia uniflora TaxID=39325 RepID=A0A7J7P526_9MAGN|nr:hypothetical protein GIB67_029904 [Kingdonia uniflora]